MSVLWNDEDHNHMLTKRMKGDPLSSFGQTSSAHPLTTPSQSSSYQTFVTWIAF